MGLTKNRKKPKETDTQPSVESGPAVVSETDVQMVSTQALEQVCMRACASTATHHSHHHPRAAQK